MSNNTLKDIGLSEHESHIYELLLKSGEISMSHLIKESKLKHSTVYSVVDALIRKSLVTQKDIKKKIHVKAESPAKLLDIAKNQSLAANSALTSVQSMLPSFLSLYINSTAKPAVRVFEGEEGVKQAYQDILNEEKFVYSMVRVGAVNQELLKWINSNFTKKRVAKKIHANVIAVSDSFAKEFKARDIRELRMTRCISQKSFSLENEIHIYGEKVAFIYNGDEYPMLGIIIQHPMIARTCKSWFDLAWIGLGK